MDLIILVAIFLVLQAAPKCRHHGLRRGDVFDFLAHGFMATLFLLPLLLLEFWPRWWASGWTLFATLVYLKVVMGLSFGYSEYRPMLVKQVKKHLRIADAPAALCAKEN